MESKLNPWVGSFVGIAILAFLMSLISRYFFIKAGERLTARIRQLFFKSILRQDIGWFDFPESSSGILTSRLSGDITLIEGMLGSPLSQLVQNMFTLLASIVIALVTHWLLALVVLAVSPLIVLSNGLRRYVVSGHSQKNQDALAEANQIASESIGNIRTVAAFTSEDKVHLLSQPLNALGIEFIYNLVRKTLSHCYAKSSTEWVDGRSGRNGSFQLLHIDLLVLWQTCLRWRCRFLASDASLYGSCRWSKWDWNVSGNGSQLGSSKSKNIESF